MLLARHVKRALGRPRYGGRGWRGGRCGPQRRCALQHDAERRTNVGHSGPGHVQRAYIVLDQPLQELRRRPQGRVAVAGVSVCVCVCAR